MKNEQPKIEWHDLQESESFAEKEGFSSFFNKKNISIALLLTIIQISILYFINKAFNKEEENFDNYSLVATLKSDLKTGDSIKENQFEFKKFYHSDINQYYINPSELNEFIGKKALIFIPSGTFLLKSAFDQKLKFLSENSQRLIKVSFEKTSLLESLRPGDLVDLSTTRHQKSILEGLEVVEVEKEEANIIQISFYLDSVDIKILNYLEAREKLSLNLRAEKKPIKKYYETFESFLKSYRYEK